MSATALNASKPDTFERFASGMDRLMVLLRTRACPVGDLYFLFAKRVFAIKAEILALAALLASGAMPTASAQPRRRSPAARSAAKRARGENKPSAKQPALPNENGWLIKLLAHEAAVFGAGLYEQIQEPQMQALLAAYPHLGDRLREIFLACGPLRDAEHFLPPPRSERFRRHRAAARAEEAAQAEASAAAIAAYEAAKAAQAAKPAQPTTPPPNPNPYPYPSPHTQADRNLHDKVLAIRAAFVRG